MRLKWLPLTLAGLHAVFVILSSWNQASHPDQDRMLPLFLISLVDLPCLALLTFIGAVWHAFDKLMVGSSTIPQATFFVVFGSLWFYLIGWCIRWTVNKALSWKHPVAP